jgi:hypothetical protein
MLIVLSFFLSLPLRQTILMGDRLCVSLLLTGIDGDFFDLSALDLQVRQIDALLPCYVGYVMSIYYCVAISCHLILHGTLTFL